MSRDFGRYIFAGCPPPKFSFALYISTYATVSNLFTITGTLGEGARGLVSYYNDFSVPHVDECGSMFYVRSYAEVVRNTNYILYKPDRKNDKYLM